MRIAKKLEPILYASFINPTSRSSYDRSIAAQEAENLLGLVYQTNE